VRWCQHCCAPACRQGLELGRPTYPAAMGAPPLSVQPRNLSRHARGRPADGPIWIPAMPALPRVLALTTDVAERQVARTRFTCSSWPASTPSL